MKMSGAEILAAILEEAGITVVSGIPGHTVIDFALAVGDKKDVFTELLVRHEATSAFAADAYFRVSGKLMAPFTHAFPGAANALTAVANAYADFSTMLFITGNTASVGIGRGGYQELSRQTNDDLTQFIRPAVKRVWQPRTASDLAHNALAALREATSGRPGPVALNVSQEIWSQEVEISGLPNLKGFTPQAVARPDAASIDAARELLTGAERPVILAGNGVNLGRARAELKALAEALGVPVATTAAGKGAFPENHPLSVGVAGWVGTGTANTATREADVVLVLGARLAETTASSWVEGATFSSSTKLIQADADMSGVANAYPVEVALLGDMRATLADLGTACGDAGPTARPEWFKVIDRARAEWNNVAEDSKDPGIVGAIRTGAVIDALRRAFPGTINMVNDCGKHHKWVVQQLEAREDDYILSSMGGASMGFGLAGAIGAHLARPDVPTIAWLGDGGMAMSLAALPTVGEYRLPIVTVVIDDASYGVVHNTQMAMVGRHAFADFDGSGTNPDYRLDISAVAEGCGIAARTVTDPGELDAAFKWAADLGAPAVITVHSEMTSVQPSGGGQLRPLADNSRNLVWKE
ncbi:MAG: thiamine pyrophosphate-binding protein [Hyphomicrobiales bacterium]|nr:MAG: thiamine pyrophosphate-binding protein [Hyphomicrobiales bacterium]